MTKTFVALLRGVNVGKGNRLAMADLRRVVEGLGYENVRTLLNSGNVVFGVPSTAKGDPGSRVEGALATEVGVQSRVTAFDAAALDAMIDENPLGKLVTDHSRLLVTVPAKMPVDARLQAVLAASWDPEAIALGSLAIYVWCPNGVLESRANAAAAKILGDAATSRNWATMLKLQAICSESG